MLRSGCAVERLGTTVVLPDQRKCFTGRALLSNSFI